MRGTAEFQIIGRVGKVTEVGAALKVSIAADYPKRQDDGGWDSNTHWNTVTVFNEPIANWITGNVTPGDLVQVQGRLRENAYEKGGRMVYTVDLVALDFNRLAARQHRETNDEDHDIPL